MIRLLAVLAAATWLLAPLPADATANPAAVGPVHGTTIVSLTFDGTFKSQQSAAQVLAAHGMEGTFYVNSGYLGYPAYLSVDQVRTIASSGNEIGGASLYGNDLATLPAVQARTEVCDDRATLAQLGFRVTSFAYPYAESPPAVKSVVQACGYDNARDYSGLRPSMNGCSSCPLAESVPPNDDFRIRTQTGSDLGQLEQQVINAENSGGGWVPLVFTRVCACSGSSAGKITPAAFAAFVSWLGARPPTTVVRTVDQVMGGPVEPAHGTALARLFPIPPGPAKHSEPLSKEPAWTVLGHGIDQAQIVMVGLVISTVGVISYRLATRRARYVH